MNQFSTYPFYLRLSLILLLFFLSGALVFIGQDIIAPLAFSILLAMLLLPANIFLEKRKVKRVPAIIISLTLALIVIAVVIYIISIQITSFTEDIPVIKKHLNDHYITVQKWVYKTFNITRREQTKLIDDATDKLKDSGTIGETFFSFTKALMVVFLLPVYTFLLLYYRDMIKKFLVTVFHSKHENKVREVLQESRSIVQGYMTGLMIEMAIVAVINIAGFLILGISYPVLLGVIAAILNMIPYIGMLIAGIFCMLVTLSTSQQIADVIWVAVVLTLVQFIDNNLIMPKVVSSKVKINALISIVGVLIGGALCGVSGMFLSIPSIAILKVIFDRVDDLKPWGMLLGDDITGKGQGHIIRRFKNIQKRKPVAIIETEYTTDNSN